MTHARPLAVLALALALATPVAARAQSAADLGFHAGQNALEAVISYYQPGIGYLHFTSPTSAVTLRVAGALRGAKFEILDDNYTSDDVGSHYGGGVTVNLGLRRYRSIAHGVAGLAELGALGTYSHEPRGSTYELGGGVYFDFGGQYALSPNFSLGVVTGIAGTFTREYFSGDIAQARLINVGTNGTRAVATFYF